MGGFLTPPPKNKTLAATDYMPYDPCAQLIIHTHWDNMSYDSSYPAHNAHACLLLLESMNCSPNNGLLHRDYMSHDSSPNP